jgi:hypothetical protein
MMANIHALNGILAHSLSIQAIKAYVSDRVATGISGCCGNIWSKEEVTGRWKKLHEEPTVSTLRKILLR